MSRRAGFAWWTRCFRRFVGRRGTGRAGAALGRALRLVSPGSGPAVSAGRATALRSSLIRIGLVRRGTGAGRKLARPPLGEEESLSRLLWQR